ncbi:AAR2 splicing factor-like protein [Aphelenchoides bicaudatus]|nr:AAR2 splicing factor-like protein [Aphelenchoides bicaudatus]
MLSKQSSAAITLTANNFVAEESDLIRNGMPQQLANDIYENGGFVIIQGLPKNIEVGIDYRTFIATEKFLGFKMISPGLHFLTIRYKNAPNISFFLTFEYNDVYCLKWNQQNEDLEEEFKRQSSSDENIRRMLMTYDDRLAVYPFTQYQQWQQLISHVNPELVKRLKPTNSLGKYNEEIEFINNEDALAKNEDLKDKAHVQTTDKGRVKITDAAGIPLVKDRPGYTIFFTKIPSKNDKLPTNRTHLETLLERMTYKELLGEFQYSFIVFMVGQSYVGLQQWKNFLFLLSDCAKDLKTSNSSLFNEFVVILYSQLKLFEDGTIDEIFFGDNFLQAVLSLLFANIEDSDNIDSTLKRRSLQLKGFCEKKFEQTFDL